jgi:hypothetical protein
MPIDLNILLDQQGELLPDLNEAPAYEQEDAITHLKNINFMKMKPHF